MRRLLRAKLRLRVLCKPSVEARRQWIFLVAVPAKHLLVAQRPWDVQVSPGTPLRGVRGLGMLEFLFSGHEGFPGSPSHLRKTIISASPEKKLTAKDGMRQIPGGTEGA
jgi:hypothetical protein